MGVFDGFAFNIPNTIELRNTGGHTNVVVHYGDFGMAVVDENGNGVSLHRGMRSNDGKYYADDTVTFRVFDPIAARCIALKWFEEYTHGGNLK